MLLLLLQLGMLLCMYAGRLSEDQAAAAQHKVDAAWSTAHLMPLSREALFSDNFDAAIGMDNLMKYLGPKVITDPKVQT